AISGSHKTTVEAAGICSSLLLDYYLRINSISNLQAGTAPLLPQIGEHPLSSQLILRALRLNCLTTAYAPLWEELYDLSAFAAADWAFPWPELDSLTDVTGTWDYDTPLRTDYARRAA